MPVFVLDQDLGWCVDDDVDVDRSFFDTACESTSCGVKIGDCTTCGGGWVQALSYDSKDCPEDADGSIFPNCQQVACGELCEGDGECGTDTQLNNCPSKDYDPSTSGGRLDIYRKLCHTAVEPLSTPKPSTVPTPTYPNDASTESDGDAPTTPAGESDGAYTLGATGLAAAMVLVFA